MRAEPFNNEDGLRDFFARDEDSIEPITSADLWGYLAIGLAFGFAIGVLVGLVAVALQ